MLRGNRHLTDCTAWRSSGLFASPNGLMSHVNVTMRESGFGRRVAVPRGYGHKALAMPVETGQVSSIGRCRIQIDAGGAGAIGRQVTGQAILTFDATLVGGLVVSATGSASLAIAATLAPSGVLTASGLAALAIAANAAAYGIAQVTGQAVLSLTGTLQPLGIGYVRGTTDIQVGLADVPRQVWTFLAAAANDPGTMGAKLNAAGSGGVDTGALADAVLARNLAGGADGGRTVRDALRASRNRVVISGNTLTVYAEDDTTVAWTATITTAQRDPLQGVDPA
jgi:hypothetical protein